MNLDEPCQVCHEVQAIRLIGTVAHCYVCSEAFLKPLRARVAGSIHDLLHPPWLTTDEGDPRYDRLDEVTQAVWRRTRGQTRDDYSVAVWQKKLARAVNQGFITESEARTAMSRYGY